MRKVRLSPSLKRQRRPDRQFAFAPLTDIKRGRGSVRADSKNVYELLHPSEACLRSDPLRRFDMDGMKCFPSTLEVKTNRIYDTKAPAAASATDRSSLILASMD